MSGKGARQRRIEQRRRDNLGSPNVRKKRRWYERWAKKSPMQRAAARRHGKFQFDKKKSNNV